jgi:hypothetical protein
MKPKTRRIRDPVHDLIVFDEKDPLDPLAWELIETEEFQRLRRIKQLGVTEFVYPGATHTRFAHSIGVFHLARRLLNLIRREFSEGRVPGTFDEGSAKVAVLAALLHDVGHGPFSHAFEEARKSVAERRKEKSEKHEAWSAKIIGNPNGRIFPILERDEGLLKEIVDLVQAETPANMYHAIVSSSFDADRLDYVQRDRYMTGTASAAIDLTWLLDNVRVAEIDVSPSGDGADPVFRHSFCLNYKAREAAEDFLLARYRLYSTVYFHKTTRGIERMLSALFCGIAEAAENGILAEFGLGQEHPLIRFFAPEGGTIENYLAIDDAVVWGAIERLAHRGNGRLEEIARRIWNRRKPFSIDIQTFFPEDPERQRRARHGLNVEFASVMDDAVFRDEAKLTLYGEIGADDTKAQKRLMIQLPNGDLREITVFNDAMIRETGHERRFLRYYFLNESDYKRACSLLEDIRGGKR